MHERVNEENWICKFSTSAHKRKRIGRAVKNWIQDGLVPAVDDPKAATHSQPYTNEPNC